MREILRYFRLTFQFGIVSDDFSDKDQIFREQNARENKQRHLVDELLLLVSDMRNYNQHNHVPDIK